MGHLLASGHLVSPSDHTPLWKYVLSKAEGREREEFIHERICLKCCLAITEAWEAFGNGDQEILRAWDTDLGMIVE